MEIVERASGFDEKKTEVSSILRDIVTDATGDKQTENGNEEEIVENTTKPVDEKSLNVKDEVIENTTTKKVEENLNTTENTEETLKAVASTLNDIIDNTVKGIV